MKFLDLTQGSPKWLAAHRLARFEEIIACFLKQEYLSRFSKELKKHHKLILYPDLENIEENVRRHHFLSYVRGGILARLPTDIKWYFGEINKSKVRTLANCKVGDSRPLTPLSPELQLPLIVLISPSGAFCIEGNHRLLSQKGSKARAYFGVTKTESYFTYALPRPKTRL